MLWYWLMAVTLAIVRSNLGHNMHMYWPYKCLAYFERLYLCIVYGPPDTGVNPRAVECKTFMFFTTLTDTSTTYDTVVDGGRAVVGHLETVVLVVLHGARRVR